MSQCHIPTTKSHNECLGIETGHSRREASDIPCNVKIVVSEMVCKDPEWTQLAQDGLVVGS